MAWGTETILKIPPHRATDTSEAGTPHTVRATTISGTASNDNVLNGGPSAFPKLGCWVTFISDTDCYIHFGSSVTGTPVATAASSCFLPAGVYVDWWCMPGRDDSLSVIQKTAGGTLQRWQSSP